VLVTDVEFGVGIFAGSIRLHYVLVGWCTSEMLCVYSCSTTSCFLAPAIMMQKNQHMTLQGLLTRTLRYYWLTGQPLALRAVPEAARESPGQARLGRQQRHAVPRLARQTPGLHGALLELLQT
jgi:hypothetical protein